MDTYANKKLGIIIAGSLAQGIQARLENDVSVEEITVGNLVTIQGKSRRFFGMINDISLEVTDAGILQSPSVANDPFISGLLSGTATYGTIQVVPYLTIGGDESLLDGPQPVKSIPSHFSPVLLANEADIELVFGKESKENFSIGNPLDMEVKLCLDLPEFVRRSNGVFGKSGTGKTFLTRLLLAGILQSGAAVNLVFDMHSEYGWKGTRENAGPVKGLKQLFPSLVSVFTLDEKNSLDRGVSTDFVVKIGYDEIKPEDITLLRQTLNLTDQAVSATYQLQKRYGSRWIEETMKLEDEEESGEIIRSLNIHEATFDNLKRGLRNICNLSFTSPQVKERAVDKVLEYLENGKHVVLEFGRFRDITTYILVANLLTRRIYERYQYKTERAMAEDKPQPKPLVITIEEAHKFLNPAVAGQTIFGTIAREMRKYNATLLVIDQRPSGIDEEVMSQLGTKITCLLDSERDIDSVLAGMSGKSALKSVLAKLASRQQALIFGHAVPMPVAFRPRDYGTPESYKELSSPKNEVDNDSLEDLW
ncbi:MAG: ATP-binding protein [Dehalococcoidales bacterium]|jgi:DNA helicase HerA-like ATPase|nr:ATP-binding protein [Dehalococcoidales bacterium]MDD4230747.1 ATP-binding protein [Dehalococcoidales bacterium]MDD4465742.1 ATP-binding protein [Dehalococcoidales bacterium]MDD5401746.1 ATP-binding protein [Dehalococcoidales bacterium]